MDLDKLKFDERGLIPAIVVDAERTSAPTASGCLRRRSDLRESAKKKTEPAGMVSSVFFYFSAQVIFSCFTLWSIT